MADFIKTQNSFASGEVSPEFYGHDNINGLSCLENMDVLPGGGLSCRCGLTYIDTLPGPGRLIPFSVSDNEEYILVLTDGRIHIYHDGKKYQSLISPWTYSELGMIQYAQRFGTMIFVHPDYIPQILYKSGNRFDISDFEFARNDADMTRNIPFAKFEDASDIEITVTTSERGNNYATFTTNTDFWTSDSIDGRLELLDCQWVVSEYISPTTVIAYTNGGYKLPDTPVTDWRESVFSKTRGWPCSITFHQDRLVFGGTRSWPGGIWMSQVGRHTNFNPGTGLDDEAIFITLLSQQRQQICTVVSSDNLQILTNVGEWAISSKPLTPSSVDIKQHTSVGSYSVRYLPPQRIEGATVFVSASGRDLRELSLDELGENYNANDLCLYAKHLLESPIDIAYNDRLRQLFVVRQDGVMAVLNQNASLGISAWGRYTTNGTFVSVAVCDGRTYVVVNRDGAYGLEYFDSNANHDNGAYDYSFSASSLPIYASGHAPEHIRLRKVVARIIDTKSIYINNRRIVLPNEIYTPDSPGYSGDVSINVFGTINDTMRPVWTIHGTSPYRATVLSVCIHGWYSV